LRLPGGDCWPSRLTQHYIRAVVIITCEQCQTRFKVPDEKLGAGPVRMRCSKCNHVFTASPAPSTPPTAATAATGATSDPFAGLPQKPAATMPWGMPAAQVAPSSTPTLAFGAGPSSSSSPPSPPSPSLSPPASGPTKTLTFAASTIAPWSSSSSSPSSSSPQPTATLPFGMAAVDPFAALNPRTKTESFGAASVDPFSQQVTRVASPSLPPEAFREPPRESTDPFAQLGKPPPPADPFAALVKPSDPFASTSTAAPSFGKAGTPSDPFAALGKAPPPPDPFARSPEGGRPAFDRPGANPFVAAPSSDPFAALQTGAGGVPADNNGGGRATAPPRLPEESDPFAGIEMGDDVDANRAALFGAPPPAPTSSPPPMVSSPPTSQLPTTLPPAPAPTPEPPPSTPWTTRLAPFLRAALVVVQGALFVVFLVVAVVLGRGGSLAPLLDLDLTGALGGDERGATLLAHDVSVARRSVAGADDIVVVTGVVHHRGDEPYAGVRVEVRFDDVDAVVGTGWAWSELDGQVLLGQSGSAALDALLAASTTPPKAPRVVPGDHAPFALVLRAPPEGTRVHVTPVAAVPQKQAPAPSSTEAPSSPPSSPKMPPKPPKKPAQKGDPNPDGETAP
jgi:predicted Zn finger-like uncharacterized protein